MGPCASSQQDKPVFMTEELQNTKIEGFSSIYRKSGVHQLEYKPYPQVDSVLDLYKYAAKNFANRNAIGSVLVKKSKDSEGKDVEQRSIRNITYSQLYDSAHNIGKLLIKKNLAYREKIYGMNFIGIYSKNRYEWLMADWACVLFGITSIPLYDTLGVENLSYCLNQTELTTMFVSDQTAKVLLKLENWGNLRTLILFDPLDQELEKRLKSRKIEIIYFADMISQGAKITDINNASIVSKADDCYTFCYTSGTTGPPKGAMLSHKNALAFARSASMHTDMKVQAEDVYVSYLPLPHVMERFIAVSLFCYGAHLICSCGDVLKLKDDCQVIKPTILLSVPRLYNRIVQAVKGKFAAETGIKKWLIESGVSSKLENLRETGEYKSGFYDSVVFSKVKEGFGGRVRVMASGSAPLSPETHEFMMAIMCCPLVEGYGQTESSAGVLYSNTLDKNHGQFAQLAATVEVRTCDLPEMRYKSTDSDSNGHQSPRGQLWIKGPHVFIGYYKQPDLTAEAITSDGWLKTGDVVQIMPHSNAFKIIDRKKNIFKLQQGEYVAPEKVEHVYSKNPHELLNPSEIFLHGESSKNNTVLISTPLKDNLMKFAKENGFNGSYEEVIKDRKFRACVLKELNTSGRKQGLNGFEIAKNVYFEPEGFMNKNILTNTMKLIRFEAKIYYKEQIEQMYQEGDITAKQ